MSCNGNNKGATKTLDEVIAKNNEYFKQRLIELDEVRRKDFNDNQLNAMHKYVEYERLNILRGKILQKLNLGSLELNMTSLTNDSFFLEVSKLINAKTSFTFSGSSFNNLSHNTRTKVVEHDVNRAMVFALETMKKRPNSICGGWTQWSVEIIPEKKVVTANEKFEGYLYPNIRSNGSEIDIFIGEFNDEAVKYDLRGIFFSKMSEEIKIPQGTVESIAAMFLKPNYKKLIDEFNVCKFQVIPKGKGEQKLQGVWILKSPEGGFNVYLFEYDYTSE